MKKIKPGDKITVLFPNDAVVLTHVIRTAAGSRNKIAVASTESDAGGTQFLKPDHEGSIWIRGHHLPEANEVKAARAARALSPEQNSETPKSKPDFASQIVGQAIGAFAYELLKGAVKPKGP